MLPEAVAQTLHPGPGEHPSRGRGPDSLVPRPPARGLPRPPGPVPPPDWEAGLVRDGQMLAVSARPGDVLQPPQVSQPHLG